MMPLRQATLPLLKLVAAIVRRPSRDMRFLQGKCAVISGSTNGVGLGIAHALAGAGADIMLNGLGDIAKIKEARDQISKDYGVRVAFNSASIREPRSIERMVEAAADELGHVDILVNNAGVQDAAAAVESLPVEKWDAVIATNLTSYFHAIRVALPQMKKRNWGRIVNIASTYGLVASVDKAAYVAAIHGVIGLTKAVALENATTSITCNAICPGWVLTRLTERQLADEASRESISMTEARANALAGRQPSQKFVTIEQIGALTAFLCSDGAAEMRGVALPIDGGWTAQ